MVEVMLRKARAAMRLVTYEQQRPGSSAREKITRRISLDKVHGLIYTRGPDPKRSPH